MSYKILGVGSAVPERVVTNDELSTWVETNDEWIVTRSGIRERHIATTDTTVSLSVESALRALEAANVQPEELDLIIGASITADYLTPSMACAIQSRIGASCPAFDVNAACSGFLYAMDVAAGYFARKKVKKVLIVATEVMSRAMDWNDRTTCVLFGDGSGAAVLGEGDEVLSSVLTAEGNTDMLVIPGISGNCPLSASERGASVLHMDGKEVFKFAVQSISRDLERAIREAGITHDQVDWVVCHQANIRIIDAASRSSAIPREKFFVNIDRYGNTSCASIGIALDEMQREGKLKSGQNVAMIAFGGGLTTACTIVRWV